MAESLGDERQRHRRSDQMNLNGMIKHEYQDDRGVPRTILVKDSFQVVDEGIPLLDLSGLELPREMEDCLVLNLRLQGIAEYADALKPGSQDKIAQALRAVIKASVQDVLTICQREQSLLSEAGYK